MSTLFISHSSSDRAATDRVCGELKAAGFGAIFLDFDPDDGIPAGRKWEREIYAKLRSAGGVVFVASEAAIASRWCFAEISLARSLNRPIFPIRLGACGGLSLLDDVQWVDLDSSGNWIPRVLAGLRRSGLDPAESFRWDAERPPYPGLAPFAADDAAVFFGRDDETRDLVERLQPTLQHGSGRFIAIVGPSGSGKSSLLRAGLIPRLAKQADRWVVLRPFAPERQPIRNLAASFSAALEDHGRARPIEHLARQLTERSRGLEDLALELTEVRASDGIRPNLLVAIDQAEELITRCGVAEQQDFLALVTESLGPESPLWCVATLRSEYLSAAPDRAGLADAVNETVIVESLSRSRLGEVILRPAEIAGLQFAPGVVERAIGDTAGGDALPLLGFTLRELSQRVHDRHEITMAAYDELGGVVGALKGRADKLTQELGRRGLGDLVLPTLMRLATVDGDTEPTRRRVARSALDDDEQTVIQAFVDASLLISGTGADRQPMIEVAHEALLRQWPPLQAAIERDRASIQVRSDLERLAGDWRRGDRDESYLLRGERFAVMNGWASTHERELDDLEQDFISACRALATRELESSRRSIRRLRLLVSGLAVLLIAALAAGLVALEQNESAQRQTRFAWSEQLGSKSDELVGVGRPDTAVLTGLESMSFAGADATPPTGLVTALAENTHPSHVLAGHSNRVERVAYSPDGRLLATASTDMTVRLWDAATATPRGPPLVGHTNVVSDVAFSPDGRLLASTGEDDTLRFWDVATGQPRGPAILCNSTYVYGVAFSPDGKLVATVGADRAVRLWDVATGRPHGPPLVGQTDNLNAVAFSPDGRLLASASGDSTIRLWDVATGQPHGAPLTGHTNGVNGVAFSPDGRLLASGGSDMTVRLWDVATSQPHGAPLTGHVDWVYGVAFSPDGQVLASASSDLTVRLWNVATGQADGAPLTGHTNTVEDVKFSPDGRHLASASWDDTARIWDLEDAVSISRSLPAHAGEATSAVFSPDGRLLATTGADDVARLWDTSTWRPRGSPLSGHTSTVNKVAFSPDGLLLATASNDGTARLWDLATGRPHGPPLNAQAGYVTSLAFSPDGRLLATANSDYTARLWDVATGQQHGPPLKGHVSYVNDVAFSPDGRLLATASSDESVGLWDVATSRQHGQLLLGHEGEVTSVAFSPDGRLVASGSKDNTARLWDVATGLAQGPPLVGHTNWVDGVAFTGDGRQLATVSLDQSVRLWDVATGLPRGPSLTGAASGVVGVAIDPTGRTLAATDQNGNVRLWNLRFTAWVSAGCGLVNHNLSLADWNQVATGIPYQKTCPGLPAGSGAAPDAPDAPYPPSLTGAHS